MKKQERDTDCCDAIRAVSGCAYHFHAAGEEIMEEHFALGILAGLAFLSTSD